jgi:DsbC/DsbD-like thiol-disulfide interchange protein
MRSASFRIVSLGLILCLVPSIARAQGEDRMEIRVTLDSKDAVAGATIMAKVKLDVKPGFHTYPTKQKTEEAKDFITTISVKEGGRVPVERTGDIKEPTPKEKMDPELKVNVGIFEEPVELEVPLKIKAGTRPGQAKFTLTIATQVCDKEGCVPFKKDFDLTINVRARKTP